MIGLGPIMLVNAPPVQAISVPTDLPNLALWHRADLGVSLSSGNVSDWLNHAGTAGTSLDLHQATSGLRPQFNASDAGFGGRPTVGSLTASPKQLLSGVLPTPIPPPFTWYIACQAIPASFTAFIWGKTVGGNIQGPTIWSPFSTPLSLWDMLNGNSSLGHAETAYVATGAHGSKTVPSVCCFVFNGASTQMFINSLTNSGTVVGTFGTDSLTQASYFGNWDGTPGDASSGPCKIAEDFMYAAVHDAQTRARVMAYLSTRYSIPVT